MTTTKSPNDNRLTLGLLIMFEDSRSFEVWQGAVDAAHSHDVTLISFPAGYLGNTNLFRQNPRRILCDLIGASSLDGLITLQWWASQTWFEQAVGHVQVPVLTIVRQYPGFERCQH